MRSARLGQSLSAAAAGQPTASDRLLIFGRRHLESVVRVYADHYNEHRQHRSLAHQPPLAQPAPMIAERTPIRETLPLDRLRRHDRLGGLLHEYKLAA